MIKKFHQWEQDILSFPTRKQYNHVSNNLEIITIQARLLEYLNRRPQDTKKKKNLFQSDDCINYLWHRMPLQ